MALAQIPKGKTGLPDWLAMNTTARVFRDRLKPDAQKSNRFIVVTLTQKLKGRVAFRNDEILRMAKVLDIPTSNIPDYFFASRIKFS